MQQLFSAGAYGGISHAKGTAHSRYVVISVAFLWLLEPASLSGFLLVALPSAFGTGIFFWIPAHLKSRNPVRDAGSKSQRKATEMTMKTYRERAVPADHALVYHDDLQGTTRPFTHVLTVQCRTVFLMKNHGATGLSHHHAAGVELDQAH